jgi:hypothetical protein
MQITSPFPVFYAEDLITSIEIIGYSTTANCRRSVWNAIQILEAQEFSGNIRVRQHDVQATFTQEREPHAGLEIDLNMEI